MRIYELAKEMGITSKDLMDYLSETMDLDIKSHFTALEDSQIDFVREHYPEKLNQLESNENKETETGITEEDTETETGITEDELIELREDVVEVPEIEEEIQEELIEQELEQHDPTQEEDEPELTQVTETELEDEESNYEDEQDLEYEEPESELEEVESVYEDEQDLEYEEPESELEEVETVYEDEQVYGDEQVYEDEQDLEYEEPESELDEVESVYEDEQDLEYEEPESELEEVESVYEDEQDLEYGEPESVLEEVESVYEDEQDLEYGEPESELEEVESVYEDEQDLEYEEPESELDDNVDLNNYQEIGAEIEDYLTAEKETESEQGIDLDDYRGLETDIEGVQNTDDLELNLEDLMDEYDYANHKDIQEQESEEEEQTETSDVFESTTYEIEVDGVVEEGDMERSETDILETRKDVKRYEDYSIYKRIHDEIELMEGDLLTVEFQQTVNERYADSDDYQIYLDVKEYLDMSPEISMNYDEFLKSLYGPEVLLPKLVTEKQHTKEDDTDKKSINLKNGKPSVTKKKAGGGLLGLGGLAKKGKTEKAPKGKMKKGKKSIGKKPLGEAVQKDFEYKAPASAKKKVRGASSGKVIDAKIKQTIINVSVGLLTAVAITTIFISLSSRDSVRGVNYDNINNSETVEQIARSSYGDTYVDSMRDRPMPYFEEEHVRVMNHYLVELGAYLNNPTNRTQLDVATIDFFTNLEYVQAKALEKEQIVRQQGQSSELSQTFMQNHEFIEDVIGEDSNLKAFSVRLMNGYDASNLEYLKASLGVESNEDFVKYMGNLMDVMFYTYYDYMTNSPQTRLGVVTDHLREEGVEVSITDGSVDLGN